MTKTNICTKKNNVYLFTGKNKMWFMLNGRRYRYNEKSAKETYDVIKTVDKREDVVISKSMMSRLQREKVPYNSHDIINMFIWMLSKVERKEILEENNCDIGVGL